MKGWGVGVGGLEAFYPILSLLAPLRCLDFNRSLTPLSIPCVSLSEPRVSLQTFPIPPGTAVVMHFQTRGPLCFNPNPL